MVLESPYRAYVTIDRLVLLGLFSACFSVHIMCSTMYQVSVECHVGAVAPGLETIMTSFTGRN